MDRDISGLTVLAILLDLLDVDAPSSSVDGHDLAFDALTAVLLAAGLDEHGIVLAHGNGAALILILELSGETAGHELSTEVARSGEVSLSGLSSRAGHGYNEEE